MRHSPLVQAGRFTVSVLSEQATGGECNTAAPGTQSRLLRVVAATWLAVRTTRLAAAVVFTSRRASSWRVGFVKSIERDFARLRVDFDYLYLNDVAEIENVFDLADAAVGHA